jgi:hypothetical protein
MFASQAFELIKDGKAGSHALGGFPEFPDILSLQVAQQQAGMGQILDALRDQSHDPGASGIDRHRIVTGH